LQTSYLLILASVFTAYGFRLRNDLYCVGWGVKLYSLTTAYGFVLVGHKIIIMTIISWTGD